LAQLEQATISLFAVDEAHCISEWGHNFRPDYLKLAARARDLGAERVLALTATATPAVVGDICGGFGIAEADAVVTGFYRPNLSLLTTPVQASERDQLLIDRLRDLPPGTTIVYVTLQRTALRVASLLAAAGLPARPYHAGLSTEERVDVQEWWTASDRNIVVATIAFGMGIDKADVRYVYHLNLPKGLESYSQEIGRAGRDGAAAVCELFACSNDIPTLENFAFGDTPTSDAIAALLDEVFAHDDGAQFVVAEYELSGRLDVRPLVLKTILTYLELDGLLRQGTPFYAGYSFRPTGPSFEDVFAAFDPARAGFLRRLVASGRTGRVWTALDPEAAAAALGEERSRIVAALTHLEEKQLIELRVSDARQRYTVLAHPDSRAELLARLVERFGRREQAEVDRIARVVSLVTLESCQVNGLVGYFGEVRVEPCGHCSFCLTGSARRLPESSVPPPLAAEVESTALAALAGLHPAALGAARQRARFLCGITSPATTRAKLTRNDLFGVLAERRFAEVLDWCASGAS
jgi:ATP-dependent DNA helicase RecQ